MEEDKTEDEVARESEDQLSEEELDEVSGGWRPDGGGGGNVNN
jgi:bacteriocin-like protein